LFFLRADRPLPAAPSLRAAPSSAEAPRHAVARRHVVAPPAAAFALFGAGMPQAERYAALLYESGVERGLIGAAEVPRLWERHLMNCAAVTELVPQRCSLVDLGSGAGLPGIVIAMLRPAAAVTLLEPMARRVSFLEECVATLDLRNVSVLRARAEEVAGQVGADVVTARAVAPLHRLAGLAAGLVRQGGLVLAIKGATAADEVAAALPELRRLDAREVAVVAVGSGRVDPAATVVRFTVGLDSRHQGG
jgi:16S rRNA (guanine527-N7)-methyltransferase